MSSEKEHWIKNPWVVGLVLIFLTPPITALWDIVKGIPYYTTTLKIWQWFVSFEVKLWWLVVYILVLGLIRAIRDEIKKKDYNKSHPYIQRTYLRFTAVKFGNFRWKWEWHEDDLTKDVDIINLVPVCPLVSCNNNALEVGRIEEYKYSDITSRTTFHKCSACNAEYLVDKYENDLKYYIEEKIRRDSFVETTVILPDFTKR